MSMSENHCNFVRLMKNRSNQLPTTVAVACLIQISTVKKKKLYVKSDENILFL